MPILREMCPILIEKESSAAVRSALPVSSFYYIIPLSFNLKMLYRFCSEKTEAVF